MIRVTALCMIVLQICSKMGSVAGYQGTYGPRLVRPQHPPTWCAMSSASMMAASSLSGWSSSRSDACCWHASTCRAQHQGLRITASAVLQVHRPLAAPYVRLVSCAASACEKGAYTISSPALW